MFGKVSKSLADAVNVIINTPVVEETKQEIISEEKQETVVEKAPPGFEGTVKAMKKHSEIDNPFALAWSMKNKGYKSHKKADGTAKNEETGVSFTSLRSKLGEELNANSKTVDTLAGRKKVPASFSNQHTEPKVELKKEEDEKPKSNWDKMMADVKAKRGPQPNGGSGKKQGSAYGGSKQKDKPEQDVDDSSKK